MRVLLTGGSGFLGSHVVKELIAQNHSVRALVRPKSPRDGLADVETVLGDVLDPASLDKAMVGIDAVIHCAGNTSQSPRRAAYMRRVNVEGTRNVLAAARDRRIVYTSSVAAVGATEDPVLLDEDSPWNTERLGLAYAKAKRDAEILAITSGQDVVALNPAMIYGPGDLHKTSTRPILEYLRGVLRVYTHGGIASCDVRDVARAHVAALTRGRRGERYITAGQNVSYRELFETLHQLTGLGKAVEVPYALSFGLGVVSEVVGAFMKHPFEDYNRPVARYANWYAYFDVSKAKKELGYTVTPFVNTISDTVRYWIERKQVDATTPALKSLLTNVDVLLT